MPAPFRRPRWLGVALLLLAAAALVLAGRRGAALVPSFAAWLEGLGPAGVVAFILGYAIAAVALVPGSLLTLAAGALFGLVGGTAVAFVAATLGASAAFLVSRYLARHAVERRLAGNGRVAVIDRAVAAQGRRIVLLLRLSPLVPFNLLNYVLGLTRVRFADYLVASVGMLPGTLLYVYYGKIIGEVALLAGSGLAPKGAGYYILLGIGLLATVAVTVLLTRIARRALKKVTDADSG